MTQIPDHPVIAQIERTGGPFGVDWTRVCPICDGDLGPWAYDVDGTVEVCENCFKDWAKEQVDEAPECIAAVLGVERRYVF